MNINPIQTPVSTLEPNRIDGATVSDVQNNFSSFMKKSINEVNQSLIAGDTAIERLHSGEAASLHEVMIAVEEADLSLRMFVQVRNKAIQAYDEIMRMQI